MNKVTPLLKALARKLSTGPKTPNNAPATIDPPHGSDDRPHRQSRLITVALLVLLLLLSVTTLVVKAYSYSFIESNAEMGFYLVSGVVEGAPQGDYLVAALPLNLFRVPEKLVLVVAMLNILLSIAHLSFVAWDWKAGKRVHTRAFRRNAVALHTINVILVLTALIAIFVSHKASSPFDYELIPKTPNAVSPSGYRYYRYDTGTFDLETWTCELENAKAVGEARKDYKAQCDIEVAGRTIVVPFFLIALAVAGMSIWSLAVSGKQELHSEHLWTKDVDIEMNKDGVTAKHVRVEEVELETLDTPRKENDGRLSKIEEDEQEVEIPESPTTTPNGVVVEVETSPTKTQQRAGVSTGLAA